MTMPRHLARLEHGPRRAIVKLAALTLTAAGCDRRHPDDAALAAAREQLSLAEAETSRRGPETAAQVVLTQDAAIIDLAPLTAPGGDASEARLGELLEARGEAKTSRRAWRLDEDGAIDADKLARRLEAPLAIARELTGEERPAFTLQADANARGADVFAVAKALKGANARAFARVSAGALAPSALPTCDEGARATEDALARRCDVCDQLAGRDLQEERECAAPHVHVDAEGFIVRLLPTRRGPEGCVAIDASPSPPGAAGWRGAVATREGSCPSARDAEALAALLEAIDAKIALCDHASLSASGDARWARAARAHEVLTSRLRIEHVSWQPREAPSCEHTLAVAP